MKGIIRNLEAVSHANGIEMARTYEAFVKLSACALSVKQREEEYVEEIARWTKGDALKRFSESFAMLTDWMEEHPWEDALGNLHMDLASKWRRDDLGEFYTPTEICRFMARLTLRGAKLPRIRPLMIDEPACGSGRMMLAAAEYLATECNYPPDNLRVQCTDVNATACDVCFVNMTMWGIPACVVVGNSLSLEVRRRHFTPWWFADKLEWKIARALGLESDGLPCEAPEKVAETQSVPVLESLEPAVALLDPRSAAQTAFDFSF